MRQDLKVAADGDWEPVTTLARLVQCGELIATAGNVGMNV
jgi:hypothetical protein